MTDAQHDSYDIPTLQKVMFGANKINIKPCHQAIIDLIENVSAGDMFMSDNDPETQLGALQYEIENLLEIISGIFVQDIRALNELAKVVELSLNMLGCEDST